MNTRMKSGAMLIAWLGVAAAATAQPPADVQVEVSFLLGYIDGSGCGFQRNGTWYDAQAAQKHLRGKYQYLAGANQISTTD